MKTYLGVLKENIQVKKVITELEKKELKIIKYFPKLKIVKFESKENLSEDLPFFKSIEEERTDFGI